MLKGLDGLDMVYQYKLICDWLKLKKNYSDWLTVAVNRKSNEVFCTQDESEKKLSQLCTLNKFCVWFTLYLILNEPFLITVYETCYVEFQFNQPNRHPACDAFLWWFLKRDPFCIILFNIQYQKYCLVLPNFSKWKYLSYFFRWYCTYFVLDLLICILDFHDDKNGRKIGSN